MNLYRSGTVLHSVLFTFHDNVGEKRRQEAICDCRKLGQACGGEKEGILLWQAGPNLDLRKNWHFVEVAIFRDHAALRRFQNHPAHKAHSRTMSTLADWVIGDLEIP